MPTDALLPEQRIATLRNLLDRWIAECPAILAADPERGRHHAQAIADLEQMIAALMGKARRTAIPAVFERVIFDTQDDDLNTASAQPVDGTG